jgi:hypothetical protein
VINFFLRINLSADDWPPADPVGGHLEGAGPVSGRLLSPHKCLSLSSSRVSGEFIRFSLKGQAHDLNVFFKTHKIAIFMCFLFVHCCFLSCEYCKIGINDCHCMQEKSAKMHSTSQQHGIENLYKSFDIHMSLAD